MISPATIEEIKNHIDIIEVVGDYVTLKRSGSSYKALSPFSAEKTPSFYVVPSKGIFKDFSSGKGGDAITFLMEIDGLTYVEALKYLAQKYGIEVKEEEQSDEALEAQNRKESLFILMNFAKEHFQHLLWEEEEGKSIGLTYFRERGFTDESIKDFELGYSVEAWDHLLKTAEEKGYKRELLEEAGLVVAKEGGKVYDRFRARVMFPIHNISGKVVAFGARMLGKDKKQPKYLNSPETELYNKSRVLYGLYQAKQEIRKEDRVYLVEGYTDVISMHQTGIKNVVSSSGTALTADQIKLIKRYTDNVTVIFDGDAAGIRASIRGIDMLLEGGLNVRAVALPDGEDPDSYARSLGTTAFSHFIDAESQDIIRFKTKLFLKEASDDPVKRAALIKDIVRTITKIDDPVKRTVYLKECSDLLGISEQALVAEQNKLLIQKSQEQRQPNDRFEGPPPVQPQEMLIAEAQESDQLDIVRIIELQERESARVLVNYGKSSIVTQDEVSEELLSYFLAEVEEIQFTNPVYKEILEIFKRKLAEGVIVDGDYLLDHGSEAVKQEVVNLMTSRYEVSENWEKKFQIYIPKEQDHLKDITYSNILRLKFRIVQHLIAEENKKLKNATDIDEIDQLLDEINEYKKIEMSIAKSLGNVTVK